MRLRKLGHRVGQVRPHAHSSSGLWGQSCSPWLQMHAQLPVVDSPGVTLDIFDRHDGRSRSEFRRRATAANNGHGPTSDKPDATCCGCDWRKGWHRHCRTTAQAQPTKPVETRKFTAEEKGKKSGQKEAAEWIEQHVQEDSRWNSRWGFSARHLKHETKIAQLHSTTCSDIQLQVPEFLDSGAFILQQISFVHLFYSFISFLFLGVHVARDRV
ncbi:hypothetical protein DFH27DRAFT_543849 [Peziza echinospora]|nr:hypothetical protein DFH27DRAFT_543849 [Peziza echinospora]